MYTKTSSPKESIVKRKFNEVDLNRKNISAFKDKKI